MVAKHLLVTTNKLTYSRGKRIASLEIFFDKEMGVNYWNYTDFQNNIFPYYAKDSKTMEKIIKPWLEDDVIVTRDFSESMKPAVSWRSAEREEELAEEAREQFAITPVMFPIFNISGGSSRHVGDGIWVARCRSCNKAMTYYGAQSRHSTIGDHEVEMHDDEVAGINVAMLPSSTLYQK